MVKIRADLMGVVHVYSNGADAKVLKAGDEVPEGYVVGDHLLDEPAEPEGDGEPKAPAGNASRAAWAEYAAGLGLEVADDATRNDIRALTQTQG